MKPIFSAHNQTVQQQIQQFSQSYNQKQYSQLVISNKQKQQLVNLLQIQIQSIEKKNKQQKQILQTLSTQLQELNKQQEQKNQIQDEEEMNQWINSVQKHSGLPQSTIDNLLTMEFQGGQNQICLTCYAELSIGSMCTYLPCSHLFHQNCIKNHLLVNKHCPACQQQVLT